MAAPTLCLCMIVRDEAAVIERCLASVRDLVDHWVICDTGSTDGTQELVRRALEGVPGELHQCAWVDFGHNRSLLMRHARGKADYLLLLDADHTFDAKRGALEDLSADKYLVRIVDPPGAHELWGENLVRGDREWWYVGAVHEYIATHGTPATERLRDARITDWLDGSVGRHARFQRDVEVLEAALEEDPTNSRNVFYLAQTYRDLGRLEAAIHNYLLRASMGGWDEEVFYSEYQAGRLRMEVGDWEGGLAALLRAYHFRPTRVEPLYEIARRHRLRGDLVSAHLFAKCGIDRPVPDDTIFLARWIFEWGMLCEYALVAGRVGETRAAAEACDRLLAMPNLPDTRRREIEAQRRRHVEGLMRGLAARQA